MGRCNSRVASGEVTKVPIWVKMHNVPLLAYSEDGMSLIATKMGKPVMLDTFTCSMCVESWGGISFARALIEVSSDSDLKKEVIMAIPNEEGTRFGHGPTTCPNRVKKDVQKAPSMAANKPNLMADQEEVFVKVKARRKKGKAGKDMGDASNLGANDQKEGSTSQSSFGKTSIVEDLNLKNSFKALKDSNNIFEAQGSCKQSSMWIDDLESDDEVDEVLFPKGNKFRDQFNIRLKGRVRK
ncbi:reverse transcriptase domain-containing protein [Tanacetum coccineum]